jgi:hypothetical protein
MPPENPFVSPLAAAQDHSVALSPDAHWQALRKSLSLSHVCLYLLALGALPMGCMIIISACTRLFYQKLWPSPEVITRVLMGGATGLILIVCGLLLLLWALAVGRFRSDPSPVHLERMLLAQARFWRISAIGFLPLVLFVMAENFLPIW